MAKTFQLCVVTTEGTVLDTKVAYCGLQTPDGSLGILANHAPMMCILREGELSFRTEDGEEGTLRHSAGVARVKSNVLTLLADRAEDPVMQEKKPAIG
jgi:F-type H+-transporting ATPase subunit epsilon